MGRYFKKVTGERLYLSPMNVEDYEQYAKWLNDSEVTDGLGNTTQLIGIENEKEALARLVKEKYNFAVVRLQDDTLIGNASLMDLNHISRTATCGIFIGEAENRGKGYGKEALRLLLRYGFNTLNLKNVMLKVFSFNKQAIACYKSVGFKAIGERRDSCFINGKYHNDVFMDILVSEFINSEI